MKPERQDLEAEKYPQSTLCGRNNIQGVGSKGKSYSSKMGEYQLKDGILLW